MNRIFFALVVVVAAVPSWASSSFPSVMNDHLGASAVPSCTVCHETNAGGFGTIDKAFGDAMVAAGLSAADDASVTAALDTLTADGTDSDGDGTSDVDELAAGADPNVAGGATGDTLKYGFGCGASGTPIVVVLLTLLRRRRANRG